VSAEGAASRDPELCPHPKEIVIDRSPNRSMAFGAGVHRCIGSHLARLQMRIGLGQFLTRIPDFRVVDGFKPEFEMGITRSMKSLPLVFTPVPAETTA
jgi:cytochrome P450